MHVVPGFTGASLGLEYRASEGAEIDGTVNPAKECPFTRAHQVTTENQ